MRSAFPWTRWTHAIEEAYSRQIAVTNGCSRDTRWHLNLQRGVATSSRTLGDREKMGFPVRAALGCIGVAPSRQQAISSGPAGPHGGNIDYNGTDEGAIVYLPIFEPGALLMIGDGHAGHGEGELFGQGSREGLSAGRGS
jgi:acetamidase/formamidase